jgi:formate-dependent nitrite reductase membrane component NrfD
MNTFSWSIIIGVIIGLADIIPMIKLKLPRYTIIAAFIHYFVATLIIFHINLPYIPWWLMGGIVGVLMMVPMLIHVGHDDKKPLPVITANAVIWGTAAGIAARHLG